MLRTGLSLLAGAWLLAGCGPSEEEVASTVAAQVAADVGGTVSVWPTFTPVATLTPRPPHTAQPTLTPWPTLTPRPTLTVRPTLTPNPTYTPQPSPTVPPTATTVVVRQDAGQPASQPAGQSGDLAFDEFGIVAMRGSVDQVARYILPRDTRRDSDQNWPYKNVVQRQVDCPQLLEAHHVLLSRRIARPADASSQPAYDAYQLAINQFLDTVSEWISACQAAGGVELGPISASDRLLVLSALNEAKAQLQQAINLLPGE